MSMLWTSAFPENERLQAGQAGDQPDAENPASVNRARPGPQTTSGVIRPDGTLLCYQPYGKEGLLLAGLDERSGSVVSSCGAVPQSAK